MKITAKTKLNKILSENPDAVSVLFESGLSCVGCPMAVEETLEDGCAAHGMSKKEIEDIVRKLNREKKK